MDWERMCRELQKQVAELENENRELRRSLGLPDAERSRIDAPELPAIAGAGVHMRSTPEEKIDMLLKAHSHGDALGNLCIWYGGINFLGFDKAAHGAMRLCSAELAKELMDRVDGEQETQLVLEGV